MNSHCNTDRRAFLTSALAMAAASAPVRSVAQAPEVENYSADVPAGATLWGLAVFTADEPIEILVRAGKVTKAIKGRFGGPGRVNDFETTCFSNLL